MLCLSERICEVARFGQEEAGAASRAGEERPTLPYLRRPPQRQALVSGRPPPRQLAATGMPKGRISQPPLKYANNY